MPQHRVTVQQVKLIKREKKQDDQETFKTFYIFPQCKTFETQVNEYYIEPRSLDQQEITKSLSSNIY